MLILDRLFSKYEGGIQLPSFIWINIDNRSLCNNSLANQSINHLKHPLNENGIAKAF